MIKNLNTLCAKQSGAAASQGAVSRVLRLAAAGAVFVVACAPASAQQGTGSLTFESSIDNGSSWQRDFLDIGGRYDPVRFRIRAEWSTDAGMYAFAGASFDVVIENAGSFDAVSNFVRPGSFAFAPQTIVSTRFPNSTIKIDDSRDTAAPGAGARGVVPGQAAQQFSSNFTTGSPVTIFEFQFTPDDSLNFRNFNLLYTMDPTRAMRVYTSPTGAQNSPLLTTNTFQLIDTPTPGAAAMLGMAALVAARRRR